MFEAGSTPLTRTAKYILAMARNFSSSERAFTTERIKVTYLTTEAKGLAWKRHGLQTRVDQSTDELSSINVELSVAARVVYSVRDNVSAARSEAEAKYTEFHLHV